MWKKRALVTAWVMVVIGAMNGGGKGDGDDSVDNDDGGGGADGYDSDGELIIVVLIRIRDNAQKEASTSNGGIFVLPPLLTGMRMPGLFSATVMGDASGDAA